MGFVFSELILIVLSQEPVIIPWKSCDFIALGRNLCHLSLLIAAVCDEKDLLPIGNLRRCSATGLGETRSHGSPWPAGRGPLLLGKASCLLDPRRTVAAHPPAAGPGGVWEGLGRSSQGRRCHVDLPRLLKLEHFFRGKHGSHQN